MVGFDGPRRVAEVVIRLGDLEGIVRLEDGVEHGPVASRHRDKCADLRFLVLRAVGFERGKAALEHVGFHRHIAQQAVAREPCQIDETQVVDWEA